MDVAFNESLIFFLTLSYYEGTFKKKTEKWNSTNTVGNQWMR